MEAKNPWTTLATRVVYENPWIRVNESDVIDPSGQTTIYGTVTYKNKAIGILPVTTDGWTWLVGQFRYSLNRYSWEIPEGGGRLDQDPLAEAQRELKEETGLIARRWSKLFEMHLSNSTTDEHSLVYLALDLEEGRSEPEDSEELVVKKVRLEDAFAMVADGRITDAISIAALQHLELCLLKGSIKL